MIKTIDSIGTANSLSRNPATISEAFEMAMRLYDKGEILPQHHELLSWILYKYLKDNFENIGSKESRKVLATYLKLNIPRPSLLHSLFLYLAMKIKKKYEDFKFSVFLKIWGFNNFRNDDWARTTHDEKRYPSVVQTAISLYLSEKKDISNGTDKDFDELLKNAVGKYPDDLNLIRQMAVSKIRKNEKDEAIRIYKELLLKDNRYYLWHELSKLIDDHSLKKSCLCMALNMQRQENYVGAIHIDLAKLLIEENDYSQALCELKKYQTTYIENKWKINNDYYTLSSKIPKDTQPAKRTRQWLDDNSKPILDFIYSQLPTEFVILQDVFINKKGKKIGRFIDKNNRLVNCNMDLLKDKNTTSQTCHFYKIWIEKNNKWNIAKRIIHASKEELEKAWNCLLSEVEGQITIKTNAKGQQFGFVSNCYVGSNLLKGINNHDAVKVIQAKSGNKSRAVKIFHVSAKS